MSREALLTAACVAILSPLRAQEPPAATTPPVPLLRLVQDWGAMNMLDRDDYREVHLNGGFRLRVPELSLEIRGQSAMLLLDLETFHRAATNRSTSGLPQRGIEPPAPRRTLTNAEIRARLEQSLRSVGRSEASADQQIADQALDLLRYVYCEGGVVIVREGVEVLRCDRLWLSPPDDRVVAENVELRYLTIGQGPNTTLVVRGPRLVKHGPRWTGRDLTLTTCTAAVPHAALAVGEAEIIEHDGEFEVVARGQTLQVGGTSVLPLPNLRVFTGSQSEFPIKTLRAGYSGQLGTQGQLVLGMPWNTTGGALHEWLTGRPAAEFRGEWEFGVGWIEQRGVPLEATVDYRAEGLYRGSTEAFWLDDRGEDLREIDRYLDGTPIDAESRALLRTQNRVQLGRSTTLDLVAYHMSDPAVWSEFYGGAYRTEEVPETSAYLHHADGNRLLTVGTRFNLNDFSYRDNRALADRFVEELPVITYQVLAQPLGTTPWGTPLVVDLETEVGQRRSDYDDRSTLRVSDRTLRIDQLAEVSAPFHYGPWNLRPYVSGRGTYYDNTIDGGSEGRIALETGVQLGTRLSRTWSWLEQGKEQGLRHVMAPKLTYRNRFHVDDSPGDFFQFDGTDALTEQQLVRFELRNLLQTMEVTPQGSQPRDLIFLDLAQDLFPDKARDNNGQALGLFYYDLMLRPTARWLPFQDLTLAIYGDHDWREGLRTFDGELLFGPVLGLTWGLEYRTDTNIDGAVAVSARSKLFERWEIRAGSQRDLDRDEWLAYSFGLRRNDHDWSLEISAVYNPFSDETTFRIDFIPRMGGISRPQRDRFGNGNLQSPLIAPH